MRNVKLSSMKLRSVVVALSGALLMGFGANAMADTTDDIVNALRHILSKQSTRDERGAFERRIAMDRFHPAFVAAQTTDIFRELISISS